MDYTRQTRFSDPRAHAALFDPLPADPGGIGEVIRNITVHYRASGIDFPPERVAEIDSRWADRLLDADRRRFDTPLAEPRAPEQRIVGCCRDFTLLAVAALRHHGIPARSRTGFADYLSPDWHYDHVVAEYWDGARWIATDAQLGLDDVQLAPGGLRPASQVWSAYRRGELDVETFGVDPGVDDLRGGWFVRNYVVYELAHRRGDELLLWDLWGDVSLELGDLALIDEVADLLQSADAGDTRAEEKLAGLYADDPRLHPGTHIRSVSPAVGGREVTVDLRREPAT